MLTRLLVLVACAGLIACSRHETRIEPGAGRAALGRIAVLPFRTGGMLGEGGDVHPAPEGSRPVPESVGSYAADVLARALAASGVAVADQPTVDRVLSSMHGEAYGVELARHVGKTVSADLVALGVISRYEQRQGSALGVERPATVWYQVALIRIEDGSILARDQFDYTQRPLSADLTELRRMTEEGGLGWQTREQILDAALARTANRLVRGLAAAR